MLKNPSFLIGFFYACASRGAVDHGYDPSMRVYKNKDEIEYSYNAPAAWWKDLTAYQLKWQIEVDVERNQSKPAVPSGAEVDGLVVFRGQRAPPEYEENTRFFITEKALNLSSGEVIRGRSTLIWLARPKADAIAERPAVCHIFT
jgi:hypothetical protein